MRHERYFLHTALHRQPPPTVSLLHPVMQDMALYRLMKMQELMGVPFFSHNLAFAHGIVHHSLFAMPRAS